jgi:hypothetical protein
MLLCSFRAFDKKVPNFVSHASGYELSNLTVPRQQLPQLTLSLKEHKKVSVAYEALSSLAPRKDEVSSKMEWLVIRKAEQEKKRKKNCSPSKLLIE